MKVVLLTGREERHQVFSRYVPHYARFNDGGDINRWTRTVRRHNPDVVFVYGANKLGPELVHAAPYVLNFHGGDPERYRGLDSHLWALYHRDYDALQVTLHHVDDGLDTGDIVFQTQVDLSLACSLDDLSFRTMEECIRLAHLALRGIEDGYLPRRKQRTVGRYYSRMPDELRGRCETNLRDLAS